MALGANSDEVVPPEILSNQAYFPDFGDYSPNVDCFFGDALDNFVVVVLEVLDILAGNAVLDKVVMPLDAKLPELSLPLPRLKIEDIRHFLFLVVSFDNTLLLLAC